MEVSDKFGTWFKEHFEGGPEFMTHKDDWETHFKYNDSVKYLKPKDELARLRITVKYDCNKQVYEGKTKSIRKKGWWIGFRPKPKTQDADEIVNNDGKTDADGI
jgi:hypothetical protein